MLMLILRLHMSIHSYQGENSVCVCVDTVGVAHIHSLMYFSFIQ